MKKIFLTSLILLTMPLVTFAQFGVSVSIGSGGPNSVSDLIWFFMSILDRLIPILIGLAVLLFLWGLFKYFASDGENTKKEAVKIIGYGIVSIFVMVSLWGIVYVMANTLGVNINGYGGPFLEEKTIPNTINVDTEIIKP